MASDGAEREAGMARRAVNNNQVNTSHFLFTVYRCFVYSLQFIDDYTIRLIQMITSCCGDDCGERWLQTGRKVYPFLEKGAWFPGVRAILSWARPPGHSDKGRCILNASAKVRQVFIASVDTHAVLCFSGHIPRNCHIQVSHV